MSDGDLTHAPSMHVQTMETGTISEWKKKVGDKFGPGDVICCVETDKATVDFEAQDDGFLAKILVDANAGEVQVNFFLAMRPYFRKIS